MSGAAAKAKGSKLERDAAKILGGKRMVLSGAVGGGDIALPSDSIFNDWSWEAKSRARLPAYFTLAMKQAELECRGTSKRPAIILKEDRGNIMFCAYLNDFVQWAQALSEVGQGAQIKSTIRQIRHQLDDLERRL
jgi:hypothetical protein